MIQRVQDFAPSTSLCLQDVSVDSHSNPTMVCICLKQSKMDPFRHEVHVFVGRMDSDFCPMAAILSYVTVRPSVASPLFVLLAPYPRQASTSCAPGIVIRGSGHICLLIAMAARAGLEDSLIKMLGRWELDAFQHYLHTPRVHRCSLQVTHSY